MPKALSAFALLLGLIETAALAQPALETDKDKTLYALGQVIGDNVLEFNLTPAELAVMQAGLSDAVLRKESKVDIAVYGERIALLAEERAAAGAVAEKEAAQAFLQKMAQEPGAQRNASGLIYIPVTAGTGASPTAASTVRVHYHGTLRDGSVFDSSVDRGEPISFPLNGVIPCWTEGVQKMKVGGKSKLICPSEIAYGDRGQGPIPAGATLAFEVELLGIEAPQ